MLGATTSHAIDFVAAISNADLLYQALERVTDFPASTGNNKNILLLRPRISYSPVNCKTPSPTPGHALPRSLFATRPLAFNYPVGDCMVTHLSKLIDVSRFRLARQWQGPSTRHFCGRDRDIIVETA